MDQSYPKPFAGGAELQLPTRRPRLSTLITSSANLGYSRQGQEFSDHAAELRKHPQVTRESLHLLGAGHIKRFRRSAECTVKIVMNRG